MGILTFVKLLYFCLIGGVVIIESKGQMFVTTPSESKGLYHELNFRSLWCLLPRGLSICFLWMECYMLSGSKSLVSSLRCLCRRWRLINRPYVDQSGQMYQRLVLIVLKHLVSLRSAYHNISFINIILASERIGLF